jgi:two-component system, LytTR family, sensor kinase
VKRSRPLLVTAWLVLWTAIGLFFASEAAIRDFPGGGYQPPWREALTINLSYYWLWSLFALPAVALSRRTPIRGAHRARHFALHLVVGLAVAATHLLAAEAVFEAIRTGRGRDIPFADALAFSFRNNFHVNVLTYWAVVAMSHLRSYDRGYRERALVAAGLREQLARAELGALRMQLHPHFLFNALNSITAVLHRDPEQAESMIAQLSHLLRRALETRDTAEIALGREIDLVRNYLELAALRFGDRLRYELDVPTVLAEAMVPTFLLQPLAENAVVHGIESLGDRGTIVVRARQVESQLCLEIENDLPAAPQMARRSGGGVGVENVRARLRHLYGGEASFELDIEPGRRALARIVLPYRENADRGRRFGPSVDEEVA